MKRTIITILLSLMLCVTFLSCEFGLTASIPIDLPDTIPYAAVKSASFAGGEEASRAVGDYTYDFARIYLISNAGFVWLGDETVYKDIPYDVGEYTIENVRSSYTYDLIVAFFDGDAAVMAYAYKDDMIVKEGKDNRFTLTMLEAAFDEWLVANWTDVNSVVAFDDSLAWLENDSLMVDGINVDLDQYGNTGIIPNSINLGKRFEGEDIADELWVNTNKGIIPVDNVTASNVYDTYNLSAGMEGDVSIGESFAIPLEDVEVENSEGVLEVIDPVIVVAYQNAVYNGESSFGGTVLEASTVPAEAEWYSKAEIMEESSEGGPDLDTIIGDLDVLLLDYVLDGTNLYASTALSILPLLDMNSSIVEDFEEIFDSEGDVEGEDSEININDVIDVVSPITITDADGIVLSVNSIVLADVNNSDEVEYDTIYLGTERGIYSASLYVAGDDKGKIDKSTIGLVEGTGTKIIDNMEISSGGSDSVIAVQTPTSLMLLEEDGTIIETVEFFMGLPGMISDIEWDGNTLYVSGNMGLVSRVFD